MDVEAGTLKKTESQAETRRERQEEQKGMLPIFEQYLKDNGTVLRRKIGQNDIAPVDVFVKSTTNGAGPDAAETVKSAIGSITSTVTKAVSLGQAPLLITT